MTKKTAIYFFAAALTVFQFVVGMDAAKRNSQTYDEAVHLAAGYSYYVTDTFRMNGIDHPPLVKLIAAAPLAFFIKPYFPAPSHPLRADMHAVQYELGDFFLYGNRIDASRILGAGRAAMLLFAVLFSAAFFFCVKGLYGPGAAVFALAFWVFYPAQTANSFLVTTDYAAAAFFFLTIYFWREALAETSRHGGTLAAGAALGAALASKFSMVLLAPALAATAVAAAARKETRGNFALKSVVVLLVATIVVGGSYFFGETGIFFRGIDYILTSAAKHPRASYLMGMYSTGGWLYYFPAVFLLKTPAGLIAASVVFFILKFSRRRQDENNEAKVRKDDAASGGRGKIFYFAVPAALYFALACFSKIQIGHRHLLPIYPVLAMWAGAGVAALMKKNAAAKVAAFIMLFSTAIEFALTHPWHISYISYAAGGPARGHKYLLDSNVDWGQGLEDLSRFLKSRGVDEIYFSYFGSADPAYYGIKYYPLGFFSSALRPGAEINVAAQKRRFLAVSVTNLYANYFADKTLFAPLRDMEPVYNAAHSIFVYDLDDKRAAEYLAFLLEKIGDGREAAKIRNLRRF